METESLICGPLPPKTPWLIESRWNNDDIDGPKQQKANNLCLPRHTYLSYDRRHLCAASRETGIHEIRVSMHLPVPILKGRHLMMKPVRVLGFFSRRFFFLLCFDEGGPGTIIRLMVAGRSQPVWFICIFRTGRFGFEIDFFDLAEKRNRFSVPFLLSPMPTAFAMIWSKAGELLKFVLKFVKRQCEEKSSKT